MDISRGKEVVTAEDAGVVVHIKNEAGEKEYYENGNGLKPVTVKVAGAYSARARRAQEKNRARTKLRTLDGEETIELGLGVLADCILEWDGFTANGQPFPLTHDNALALLTQCQWIREQLVLAHNDHALFFKSA